MKKFLFSALASLAAFATVSCSDSDFYDDFDETTQPLVQPEYPNGPTMTGLTAKRVAKKVNFWGKKEIVSEFQAFNVSGADLSALYNVRIAQVANPSIHQNIIFMTAGQKISSSGHENGVTGQASNWDKNCGDAQCTGISLNGQSMAMKLIQQNWFPNAWFAIGMDNNFDYTATASKRANILKGFANWIESQITADTENVVLAGSSRGGCLVTLIAQELRKNPQYNNINIYVSSFDGVCVKSSELGVTSTKIDNPVRNSGTFYGGLATNMNAQFPNHDNLYIYQISGGQEIVPLAGIRAYSAYEGSKPPSTGTDIDWGWYKQTWVPWKHKEIGNAFTEPDRNDIPDVVADTIDAQLWHIESNL